MAHNAENERSLTGQQARAITTLDRNLVVVAGAGTGKTFVLVRRYVELLARHPDWPISAVVAITFTNRAADEMRARVRAAIERRRLAAASRDEVRRWSDLLAQIEGARITTIHGLCSEIVRANSAAAGVDPGFAVLDASEASLLREDAVVLALAEAAQGGVLIDEERALAGSIIARYDEQEIRRALSSAGLLNADLRDVRSIDELGREWVATARRLLDSCVLPDLTLTPSANADKLADIYRLALIGQRAAADRSASPDERFRALHDLTEIKLNVGSERTWPDHKHAKQELEALRERAKLLVALIGEPPGEQDREAELLLQGWRLLLQRTRYHYDVLKRQKYSLDYDDLERIAAEVLSQPEIAARYTGREFKHVMVDEFQDTNSRQWQIVKSVAPPDNPGALFLVGDPKQSIYGFRDADVTVFARAQAEITAQDGEVLYLSESFRAHAPLLDVLNTTFDRVLTRPPDALDPGVYVEFDANQHLTSARKTAPGAPFAGAYGIEPEGRRDHVAVEAREVARAVREIVRGGLPLVWDRDGYRPARYGDIAILMRSFKGKVEIFEQALAASGVPYVTSGGQGFYGRREVRDLISLLKALHNHADELALASALHSPLFAVSDMDLLILRRHYELDGGARTLPLYDALMHEAGRRRRSAPGYDSVVFAADVLAQLAPQVGRLPVDTLLQSALHLTGYMATLAGLPGGKQMRANVEKLIDRARDSGLTALNQFVRYLRDMTETEAKEGGVPLQADDAVRVTTIHSSKGLEYPIVWIADAGSAGSRNRSGLLNWSDELGCMLPGPDRVPANPDGDLLHPYVYRRNAALRDERERAESLRLLYVAATRARDALFVSGVTNKGGRVRGWLGQIQSILPYGALALPAEAPPVLAYAPETGEEPHSSADYPLARTIPAAPLAERLRLSASDITALGGWHHAPDPVRRAQFRRNIRQRVFDEQSEPVSLLTYDAKTDRIPAQTRGTLIHDSLRYGYDRLLEADPERVRMLVESMAWEHGITQRNSLDKAVAITFDSLIRFRHSELAAQIEQSDAVYRELPFVFQREGHIIHGMIDLLFRGPDGEWTVVDYKSDWVERDDLERHARTYYLQMAVYAEAIAAQTGRTPAVMLVFLRFPDQPVRLDAADLRDELESVPLTRLIDLLREDSA